MVSLAQRAREKYAAERARQEQNGQQAGQQERATAERPPEDEWEQALRDLGMYGLDVSDPRPDLVEDSTAWLRLFMVAGKYARSVQPRQQGAFQSTIFDALVAMRRVGTRLEGVGRAAKFVPVIGVGGWKSKEDFLEVANGCLKPNAEQVRAMLAQAEQLRSL